MFGAVFSMYQAISSLAATGIGLHQATEDVSSRIERQISRRHPEVTQVFLDATRASRRERQRAHRLASPSSGETATSGD